MVLKGHNDQGWQGEIQHETANRGDVGRAENFGKYSQISYADEKEYGYDDGKNIGHDVLGAGSCEGGMGRQVNPERGRSTAGPSGSIWIWN
nr:hypothetical protein [uncultured Cohaesibacter sp.]